MHVLIVADEKTIHVFLTVALGQMKHEASIATDGATALNALQRDTFDAVFLDVGLSQNKGLDLLDEIRLLSPLAAVILITADASIQAAVEAMRRGAFDYVLRPCTPEQVRQSLAKVERMRRLENRVTDLESSVPAEPSDSDLLTSCPAMQEVLAVAFKAAHSDATLLLLGESGTGKSLLARSIHQRSGRAAEPFITVNCPSLSQDLLEDELFGHAKGGFTGAVTDTWGKTAAAEGGTLFFDEIGELAPGLQVKLLRLLQERDYERVGETLSRRSNVRVMAATNRDLRQAVKDGAFREDLYYRLNVISLVVPPLRERMGDFDRQLFGFCLAVLGAFTETLHFNAGDDQPTACFNG